MAIFPLCLATHVDGQVLRRLLAEGQVGGYRDTHPWHVAAALQQQAVATGATLILLLATGRPPELTHWAEVRAIDVPRLAAKDETHLQIGPVTEVSPLFNELESVTLAPSELQVRREQEEGLRPRRFHLDSHWLHPYAICETPPFIRPGSDSDATADTH